MESREITIEDRIIEEFAMNRLLGYLKEMAKEMGIEPGDSSEETREKIERFRKAKREERREA